MAEQPSVEQILQNLADGDTAAVDRLFPVVYDQLRRLAGSYLRNENAGHTLQATALVHEAYLKLVDQDRVQWQNRAHFLAVAAQAMRRILIDHARKRSAGKRGRGERSVSLSEAVTVAAPPDGIDLLALDQSLSRLQAEQPAKASLVEMRLFGGLSDEEIGEVLGVSVRTVTRHWKYAQAWLYRDLRDAPKS
jgi:RNA polymerase sigma factor (TIGR02999 family)